MSKESIVVVCNIGLGQAGGNAALAAHARVQGSVGLINSSGQDLDTASVPDDHKVHLGNGKSHGAGKNRDEGKSAFGKEPDKIIDNIVEWSAGSDICFIYASSSGGTGSGLVSKVTAILNSKDVAERFAEKKVKVPLFFTVIITPDMNEGIKSMANTVELLNELNNLLTKARVGRYLLVSNQFGANERSDRAKYTRVNEAVAGLIARYLEDYGTSPDGCLDRADRFSGLGIPGIHAFFSFGEGGGFETPFIMPEGANVTSVMAEIREDFVLADALSKWGLNVGDQIKGYFEKDQKLVPIVHLAGFQNFPKLSERFKAQIDLQNARAQEISGVNATQGTGLKGIEDTKATLTKTYTAGSIGGLDDIDDLLK